VSHDAAFTGILVDLSGLADHDNRAFARVEDCLSARAGRSAARALLRLDRAKTSRVTSCNFASAQTAILGRVAADRYENAIQVRNCHFLDTVTAPITNPGEAWLVQGCTFEPLSDGRACAIRCSLPARALSVIGCWMGDVTGAGGSAWIDYQGNGLHVAGNQIGGS
jgi:hypothetical protein